jgi:hypothetical protein
VASVASPARRVRIAVIVPAGPRDDVLDTVSSVVQYTGPSRVILVVDDAGQAADGSRAAALRSLSPDVTVMPAPSVRQALFGGLWAKLGAGYRWILERYEPGLVLRLDADALMIGAGIEQAAEDAFGADPRVGLLGAYRVGPDDGLRDFSWAARQIRAAAGLPGFLHPRRRLAVRRYLRLARGHGYTDGEHALGGAYLHSYAALSRIRAHGWLAEAPMFTGAMIGDDHLISLMTVAAGYRIADFSGSADPMALTWRGLPAHPADLLARGKLVTHSVRSWGDLTEAEIRGIFAAARAAQGAQTGPDAPSGMRG